MNEKGPERKAGKSGGGPAGDVPSHSVEIPGGLARRVEKYAEENGMSVDTVLVEALDEYLRRK